MAARVGVVALLHESNTFLREPTTLELFRQATLTTGAAMRQAFERVMHRAFRERRPRDVDLLWYMWTGKRSPLFGKDRMATFETYFVADEEALFVGGAILVVLGVLMISGVWIAAMNALQGVVADVTPAL